MNYQLAEKIDHTLLKANATKADILRICEEAKAYHTASVCVNSCWAATAKEALAGSGVMVCCVVGFPLGAMSTAAKAFETEDAVKQGAQEIDMVINIGWVHDHMDDAVLEEIRSVRDACQKQVLKVIVECCLLSEDEMKRMCQVVSDSGADFIKTSTGFSVGGATRENVAFLRRYTAPAVQVKAAGGIASLQDAADFLSLGATRLGTSRIVKLVKEQYPTL